MKLTISLCSLSLWGKSPCSLPVKGIAFLSHGSKPIFSYLNSSKDKRCWISFWTVSPCILAKIILFIWLLVYFLFLPYSSTTRTWNLYVRYFIPRTNQGQAPGTVLTGWLKMLEGHEKTPLRFFFSALYFPIISYFYIKKCHSKSLIIFSKWLSNFGNYESRIQNWCSDTFNTQK